ncbi:hypothetical protein SAMN05421757_1116 [Tropicimonas sediminicola]|uniref:Flp pilus assembly protein, pilin Flp n=1 Tax=Tropicimonas sediminicola TaxID=1031541 RepID=A0A239LSM6_9RHOB|nr:hypothetical protein SAMN05421757_1116 [Tropicimonas sediminicola]
MMKSDTHIQRLGRFFGEEDGAVTTDWVMLTALVIGLALATHTVWRSSAGEISNDIASTASDYQIKTSFD